MSERIKCTVSRKAEEPSEHYLSGSASGVKFPQMIRSKAINTALPPEAARGDCNVTYFGFCLHMRLQSLPTFRRVWHEYCKLLVTRSGSYVDRTVPYLGKTIRQSSMYYILQVF